MLALVFILYLLRSRTLVAVHNAILDDLVYPAEIVGKRTRIRLDGSRLFKVLEIIINNQPLNECGVKLCS